MSCPFSPSSVRAKSLDRLSRFIDQTTCSRVRRVSPGFVRWVTSFEYSANPRKRASIGYFKSKHQNLNISISPKIPIESCRNMTLLRLCGWSTITNTTLLKAAILKNRRTYSNYASNGRFRVDSCSMTCQ